MNDAVSCMWMRAGTSKGGFFLADDLPPDPAQRDAFLLRAFGSPDPRQIDGMGGGDPLTSKVAIVRRSSRPGIDVEYLFLQVFVDQALVSASQNCGNMLAGVAPFAIERGLVAPSAGTTRVVIWMDNTAQVATATIATPAGRMDYAGDTAIDGVPGTAASIALSFGDIAGSKTGALLPTGRTVDRIEGVDVMLIDNGMPCVVMRADALGRSGYEDRASLDADVELKQRLEAIRLAAGPLMNLGDVAQQSVPKMILLAPPLHGGTVSTRSFIPHRCHATIGVFAAVTVATACLLDGSPAAQVAAAPRAGTDSLLIEHPTGRTACTIERDANGAVVAGGFILTARKLFDGMLFG
ncbi:4-oxalomesaconate tautomerase [Sphingomonas aracearum]|uniref:4-oxalomesaconate tautomerase n=1 Tax=Sphingomonas aracearum TaxID=2283317 RepID=A0A369VRG3_9SPHN|nr:4-oxalomesaconate tautomerase [Sphingomonas aracearum]RDE04964.1 4-oxalomesaconate tautomerase [Sphingomonas aracearum]